MTRKPAPCPACTEIEFDIATVTTPDGQIYRAHVPCCWCGEHHEEGN